MKRRVRPRRGEGSGPRECVISVVLNLHRQTQDSWDYSGGFLLDCENLSPCEQVFDGDAVDGHAGDVAAGDVDAAEVAIGEFAAGQEAVFEFDGAHGGAFGVKGVAVAEGAFGEFGAFEVEFGGFDAGSGVVDANLFHAGLFFCKDRILGEPTGGRFAPRSGADIGPVEAAAGGRCGEIGFGSEGKLG